jgi:hypothetical protein
MAFYTKTLGSLRYNFGIYQKRQQFVITTRKLGISDQTNSGDPKVATNNNYQQPPNSVNFVAAIWQ